MDAIAPRLLHSTSDTSIFAVSAVLLQDAAVQNDAVQTWAFGRFGLEDETPVTPSTVFDLASLTKVLVVVPLLLRLFAARALHPNDTLGKHLPATHGHHLEDCSILELATHCAGLAASANPKHWGVARGEALRRNLQEPAAHPKGLVVYSDQGYIALTALLEETQQAPLDDLAAQMFATLGLQHDLTYHPNAAHCAPTETLPGRGLVQGVVHDENAFALGGVSGHAGLFGTALGVARFCTALMRGEVVDLGWWRWACGLRFESAPYAPKDARAFGFVRQFPGWLGADNAPENALGHTGFTGTGLWLNPSTGQANVLLTNRVHPSRDRETGIAALRRDFNQLAWSSSASRAFK